MKKTISILAIVISMVGIYHTAYAAYTIPWNGTTTTGTVLSIPVPVNGIRPIPYAPYYVASSTTQSSILPLASTTVLSAQSICFLSDSCRTTWPTSGGGGSGNVATSSSETSSYVPFWTSTGSTPATLSGGVSNFAWNNTSKNLTATYASTTAITSSGAAYFATSNGNVGIGSTTPTNMLSIGSGATPSSSTDRKAIELAAGGYGEPGAFNTASNGDKLILYRSATPNYDGTIGIGTAGDMWFKSSNSATGGQFRFFNGATPIERMRIDDSGNVGIGTTSPGSLLAVGASAASSGGVYVSNTGIGIGTTTPGISLPFGVNGGGIFNGTVYATGFDDSALTGTSCVSEVNGILGTSNCVTSISNADGTITISPTTGNAVASLALGHANTWSATQNFSSVGIGSTTPAGAIGVQGNALISGNITSVANITATGTLTVAGTGTSTFSGPVSVPNLAITSPSAGCLQTGAGGYIQSTGSTCKSGTVTSIATNNGLTGGTITTSGTLGFDLTKYPVNNLILTYNGSQLQATGTDSLTVPKLIATTTATSTFSGGIDAARVCLTGTTTCLAPAAASSVPTATFASTTSFSGNVYCSGSISMGANKTLMIWGGGGRSGASGGIGPLVLTSRFTTDLSTTTIYSEASSNTSTVSSWNTIHGLITSTSTTNTINVCIDTNSGTGSGFGGGAEIMTQQF